MGRTTKSLGLTTTPCRNSSSIHTTMKISAETTWVAVICLSFCLDTIAHIVGLRRPGFGLTSPGFGLTRPGFGLTRPGYGLRRPGYGLRRPGFGLTSPGFGLRRPGFGFGFGVQNSYAGANIGQFNRGCYLPGSCSILGSTVYGRKNREDKGASRSKRSQNHFAGPVGQ